jgi:hypothetical protein
MSHVASSQCQLHHFAFGSCLILCKHSVCIFPYMHNTQNPSLEWRTNIREIHPIQTSPLSPSSILQSLLPPPNQPSTSASSDTPSSISRPAISSSRKFTPHFLISSSHIFPRAAHAGRLHVDPARRAISEPPLLRPRQNISCSRTSLLHIPCYVRLSPRAVRYLAPRHELRCPRS